MRKLLPGLLIMALIPFLGQSQSPKDSLQACRQQIDSILKPVKGHFALAFYDMSSGRQLFMNEHEPFHAASTMKLPIMMGLYRQAAASRLSLGDSITIKNSFHSIVDSSTYNLDPDDDSEKELYKHVGEKRTIDQLIYLMITMSSNLATNILIELVGAPYVGETLHQLGSQDIHVLRGVEDQKAYDHGLNNTVTAYDLMLLFRKLGELQVVSAPASRDMIRVLEDQHFNEIIPARLPAGVKVAHKTGSIKGVNHDAGLIILPDGRQYVLVLLSKDVEDEKAAIAAMASISGLIYQLVTK